MIKYYCRGLKLFLGLIIIYKESTKHWTSLVYYNHIVINLLAISDPWECFDSIWGTAYTSPTTYILTTTSEDTALATIRINVHHLIRHTKPPRETTVCFMPSSTNYSTEVYPPTITYHALAHSLWLVYKKIIRSR